MLVLRTAALVDGKEVWTSGSLAAGSDGPSNQLRNCRKITHALGLCFLICQTKVIVDYLLPAHFNIYRVTE